MPIPTLHLKDHAHEEQDEHDEPSRWTRALTWLMILVVIAGCIYFFISVDKEALTEKISVVSDLAEQFDEWIGGAAKGFAEIIE